MPNSAPKNSLVGMLHKIEDGILISLLLVMILVAVLQIFLRNFLDTGLMWGDGLVRVLVLWLGLIGAMIASRKNHHINIDILSRYLPAAAKSYFDLLVTIFTALICAAMAWYSLTFVLMEKQDGLTAFGNIPAWICESIIPFAFAVISIRYLAVFFTALYRVSRPVE